MQLSDSHLPGSPRLGWCLEQLTRSWSCILQIEWLFYVSRWCGTNNIRSL